MPPLNELTYRVWLSYGVGHILNDLCASMWFTYLLIFYVYILQFDESTAGMALFIGQIADGIATPIVGILSDGNTNVFLCKYTRRKSWHLLGTICVLTSFPFIFSPCYLCEGLNSAEKLLYYSFFIVLFQFGWASTQISHLSLAPELTRNQHERTSLLTLRYCFTVLSNITVYVIMWYVLYVNRKGKDTIFNPQDMYTFKIVVYIVICLGCVTSAIFHVGVDEKVTREEDDTDLIESNSQSRVGFFHSRKMYNVALVYMATRLFVNLSQVYIPIYLQSYLKLPAKNLAILPLVIFVSSFLTSGVIKPLNVEFGRRFPYIFGALLSLGACFWVQVGKDFYYKTYEIYAVAAAFGCASSIMLVTSLGITADLIGNDTNNGAFVYGLMSFCDKISNGSAVLVIQNLTRISTGISYYRDTLVISCGLAALLGLISVCSIKPIPYSEDGTLSNEESINNRKSDIIPVETESNHRE